MLFSNFHCFFGFVFFLLSAKDENNCHLKAFTGMSAFINDSFNFLI